MKKQSIKHRIPFLVVLINFTNIKVFNLLIKWKAKIKEDLHAIFFIEHL